MMAQEIQIKGKVVDDVGEPVPGVAVLIKGTQIGTITNIDGVYNISANSNATLIFSFIGLETQTVEVRGQNIIDVFMAKELTELDQVVVIGYGTVKKSDLTGSVVSVKAEDLPSGANASVESMLQGRAAGVQILQKSGEPGGAISVQVRGASSITAGNDPLYVVDGMPMNNAAAISGTGSGFTSNPNPRNPLNSLNPSDIESIEILKDASATAIYGSRGANGVVLITTKRGQEGKLTVNYDGYYGVQKVAKSLDVLTAKEYKQVLNDIIDDGGGSEADRVLDIQGNGTDWQSQLYQTASVQNHAMSFSGGFQNTSYYISLNAYEQDGVLKHSGLDRYTARVNLNTQVNDKFKLGLNINTSYLKDKYAANGNGLNENAGPIYAAINADPTVPVFQEDGTFTNVKELIQIDNPVALLEGKESHQKSYRTFGSMYAEYFILPELSAKIKIGGDVNNAKRFTWIEPYTITGEGRGGIATIQTGLRSSTLLEGTLNYIKEFGEHNVSSVLGATREEFVSETFQGTGEQYALPDLKYYAIGGGEPTLNSIGSGRSSNLLQSYLFRVNYGYKSKYLFTLSMRADGSARFSESNRYGYFPSVALGWKLSEEYFMQSFDALSNLKLRASYGAIGNQEIGNYRYMALMEYGKDAILNGQRIASIEPAFMPNSDLKWESTVSAELAVDFGFLKNRIYGTLEFYNRKTTDLLLSVPQPRSSGYNSKIENVGSMRNKGFDFNITSRNLSGAFKWSTSFNFSVLRNEVLDIDREEPIITGGLGFTSNAAIIEEGKPLFSFYGYEVDGVWQTDDDFSLTNDNVAPGDLKYKDQITEDTDGDGIADAVDGTINEKDRVILGNPFPDFNWGMSNEFSFKNFDLSVFVEGVHGVSVLNNNLVDTYFPVNFRRNKMAEPYLNRWTTENPSNKYPSFVNPTAQGQKVVNSRTVEDASYIRLQNVTLSYTFDTNKVFKKVRLYTTAQNLITITNYSGVDPSVNSNGNGALKIDYNAYPYAKTYMFGVNLTF